jgi:hypothetical protein
MPSRGEHRALRTRCTGFNLFPKGVLTTQFVPHRFQFCLGRFHLRFNLFPKGALTSTIVLHQF